jgi:hypothetical protein
MNAVVKPAKSKYLTPREVAKIRRRTETALSHERNRKQGPPWIRDGGRVLYPADELEAWLEANTVRPEVPAAS